MMTPKAVATRLALDAAEVEKLSDDEIDAAIQAYRRERSRRAEGPTDNCGAPYPERPGTTCRRNPGHSGEHATARRDVQWDNSYLSAPAEGMPEAILEGFETFIPAPAVLHSTDENAEIVKNAIRLWDLANE